MCIYLDFGQASTALRVRKSSCQGSARSGVISITSKVHRTRGKACYGPNRFLFFYVNSSEIS